MRFDPEHRRLSSLKWTDGVESQTQFADGYALLVASEGSLAELNARLAAQGHAAVGIERFRPNIVLAGLEAHDEDRAQTLHAGARGRETIARRRDDAGRGQSIQGGAMAGPEPQHAAQEAGRTPAHQINKNM